MISKSLQKLIRALEQKKQRERERLFVAEGPKVVGDLMATSQPRTIVATAQWLASQPAAEWTRQGIQVVEANRRRAAPRLLPCSIRSR